MTVLVFCCIEHTVVTDFNKMALLFAGRNSASVYLAFCLWEVAPVARTSGESGLNFLLELSCFFIIFY